MQIGYSSGFKKQYKKLPKKVREKFNERLKIFVSDKNNIQLRVHKLHGFFKGFWSINITGDIRAVYEIIDDELFYFVAIGSHSDLYS